LAHKYRVERILGQGGMGYVVEAKHIALEERVALKFLLPEYAQHPEASQRFKREAQAAAKIKSEHVARVTDWGQLDGGAPYMVMEFLDGADLARRLKEQGPLPVADAVDYVLQACEAIAEAHGLGIVHRDLKPANLFVARRPDGSPIVKVLDFGISKMTGQGVDPLTRTAAAMGSALYMSPEQMQQTRTVDHRTDIYALGIALFELVTGRPPFLAETLPQLCAEVLTGSPTPLRELRPDLPEDLAERIARAYERDKNKRYQTIADLAEGLAPYAPPHAQSSLDRIARLAGRTAAVAGAPSKLPPRAPSIPDRAPSAPELPPLPVPLATAANAVTLTAVPAATAAPSATASPLPRGAPLEPQAQTMPLLQAAALAPDRTSPLPPIPSADRMSPVPPVPAPVINGASPAAEPGPSRIVADTYNGPMSAHAAAAFAHAARQKPGSGRSLLFTALALGTLLGVGGGVGVFLLRYHAAATSDTSVTAPGATPAPMKTEAASSSPVITPAPPESVPAGAASAAPRPSASAAPSVTVPARGVVRPSAGPRNQDVFERR
jgi:serine/threonine-protein kinase